MEMLLIKFSLRNCIFLAFAIETLYHLASVQQFHNSFETRAVIKHQVFPMLKQKDSGPEFEWCESDVFS